MKAKSPSSRTVSLLKEVRRNLSGGKTIRELQQELNSRYLHEDEAIGYSVLYQFLNSGGQRDVRYNLGKSLEELVSKTKTNKANTKKK